jgi:hypothetical protein
MKRLLMLFTVLFIVAVPAATMAGNQIWAGAGFSLPRSDFSEIAKPGPQFGAGFGFALTPAFSLGGEFYYNMYGLSDDYRAELDDQGFSEIDVDVRISQYTLMARVNLMPTPQSAYVKFNAGMYKAAVTASDGDVSATADDTDFGFGLGMGYQFFGAGNTGGFLEVMYHRVPGSEETMGDVNVQGSDTEWFDLRGGVVFHIPGS